MKTTIKRTLLALTIALSIASCKKDKKDPAPTTPSGPVITENFANIKAKPSVVIDPNLPNAAWSGFTTSLGDWDDHAGGDADIFPGSQFDGSFTTAGRSYIYLGSGFQYGSNPVSIFPASVGGYGSMENDFTNLSGLKTVSVTFAGSNANPVNFAVNYDESTSSLPTTTVFNPATDYIQMVIYPYFSDGGYLPTGITDAKAPNYVKAFFTFSPKYTKTGTFYTLTWTVPTRAQLLAAGVSDGLAADGFNEQIDAITPWLKNPQFIIANASSIQGLPASEADEPVVIDKVTLGF